MHIAPRQPYVEDASDDDADSHAVVPPHAPSPPRAAAQPVLTNVNVFDFLVSDETPNASKVSLGGSMEQMQMKTNAPPIFEAARTGIHELAADPMKPDYDEMYEENGYSYGTELVPVQKNDSYETPAPKHRHNASIDSIYELDAQGLSSTTKKSTDKKRKRQVEDLDLTQARRSSQELDEEMLDAPPVLHSGLTGGLNRLLSKSTKFPPSPDYSGGDNATPDQLSPIKRIVKPIKAIKATSHKDYRGRAVSSALIKVRKVRRPSDESRPRKHHRSHRQGSDEHHHSSHRHVSDDHHHSSHRHASDETKDSYRDRSHSRPKRTLKAIEYHRTDSHSPNPSARSASGAVAQPPSAQQLILYRSRAELFMSLVTKGPESETGCSVNKILKRYHRERGDLGLGEGLGKPEEEKELWRGIRLRRNERGEIVLIC